MTDLKREHAATVTIAQSAYDDGAAFGLYEQLIGSVFSVHIDGNDEPIERAGHLFLRGVVDHRGETCLDMEDIYTGERALFPLFSERQIELRYL